jgi:Tfp pilus tip-associated adhesin PilY1
VPTTSATGINRAYLAAFQSNPSAPFWQGYLKAYQRDSTGQVAVDSNGVPLASGLAWEAGQKLTEKAADDRTIYTVVSGTRQAFTIDNTSITEALLGVTSAAQLLNVIQFIRGVDINDMNGNGDVSEERPWKLGDIFHSTPVLVTPPFLPSSDADYPTFRSNNSSRPTILLAGSDDGMLHAFRETDGEELWAFIPPDLLPKLRLAAAATGEHEYLVDGSPVAADVKIVTSASPTTPVWRTIVIFGERRGGRYYHALDITDTTNPVYLWSFTDTTKMGETWSDPLIGKVKMSDGSTTGYTDKYVAFFGGGFDSANNNSTGKAFFAVDVATGTKLWEYYNSTGATDDPCSPKTC